MREMPQVIVFEDGPVAGQRYNLWPQDAREELLLGDRDTARQAELFHVHIYRRSGPGRYCYEGTREGTEMDFMQMAAWTP